MLIQTALTGQYRAGLGMLRGCLVGCPEELWTHGRHPRTFWRIAYHALFYTHYYLLPNEHSLEPWAKHVPSARILWDDGDEGTPPLVEPYTQQELIEYLDWIDGNIQTWVNNLDLDALESGFHWYPIPKIDHQLVNIRHLAIHTGQLQEQLFSRGIEPVWISRRP